MELEIEDKLQEKYEHIIIEVNYLIQSSLYRVYGSWMFLLNNVSNNHSLTSSLRAFSLNSTVVINCSAII